MRTDETSNTTASHTAGRRIARAPSGGRRTIKMACVGAPRRARTGAPRSGGRGIQLGPRCAAASTSGPGMGTAEPAEASGVPRTSTTTASIPSSSWYCSKVRVSAA